MSLKIEIEDGRNGSKTTAQVTPRGQLVTAPLEFSESYFTLVNVDNQAFNLVSPLARKQFVVTGMSISASRSVGTAGALVEIYEAAGESLTAVSKALLTVDVARSTTETMALNFITTPGRWINVKSGDSDVYVTIFGYYVDRV